MRLIGIYQACDAIVIYTINIYARAYVRAPGLRVERFPRLQPELIRDGADLAGFDSIANPAAFNRARRPLTLTLNRSGNQASIEQWEARCRSVMTVAFRFLFRRLLWTRADRSRAREEHEKARDLSSPS